MKGKAAEISLNKQLQLNQESKVLIVGLGETGFSVAKFLHQQEIKFAIVDSREKPPLNDALLKFSPDIPVFTGGFDRSAFEVATHLMVSPGVSLNEGSIQRAIQLGRKLISDIDLFACVTEKPVIAITGSNGKSTVTTMLGDMGNAAGINTAIGGNLGTPALDLLDENIDLYVLELSSFQLERTSVLNAKAATVLNVSVDHLDRYGDIELYAKEKQKVFAGDGVMVLNEDDPTVMEMKLKGRETLCFTVQKNSGFHLSENKNELWLMNDDKALMRQSELPLEGLHNIANALAALALGTAVGMNSDSMCHALHKFKGLSHRMQIVANVNGVTWVNDSKATNVGACIAALQGYAEKVILIAGGDAKGANMNDLIPVMQEKTKCVVLLGKDAEKIENGIDGSIPAYRATNIEDAVQIAAKLAEKGENVLLSPACASLDQFRNYQDRGDKFTAAVLRLAA